MNMQSKKSGSIVQDEPIFQSQLITGFVTSDKTSSGTALYSTIDLVMPIINDVTQNYTYGWAYNSSTKALTVTCKTNLTAVISLLTVVLGPTVVPSGTSVQVLVKGH